MGAVHLRGVDQDVDVAADFGSRLGPSASRSSPSGKSDTCGKASIAHNPGNCFHGSA